MDREAWQATVHRVAKSRTRLKWLNTHTHGEFHGQKSLASYLPRSCEQTRLSESCVCNMHACTRAHTHTHTHTPLHERGLWFTLAFYYFQTWFCPPEQEGMYQFPAYYLPVPNPPLWSWNISPSPYDMASISVRTEYRRDPGGGKVSPPGSGMLSFSCCSCTGLEVRKPRETHP